MQCKELICENSELRKQLESKDSELKLALEEAKEEKQWVLEWTAQLYKERRLHEQAEAKVVEASKRAKARVAGACEAMSHLMEEQACVEELEGQLDDLEDGFRNSSDIKMK